MQRLMEAGIADSYSEGMPQHKSVNHPFTRLIGDEDVRMEGWRNKT